MHGNRLSVQTLVIASLASATAALLTSLFWESGTVFSAALMPVMVTLISEALKKPAATISEVRVRRQQTMAAGVGGGRGAPAAESLAGSSTADRPSYRRFAGRRINLKVVLVTGGLAFLIGAVLITVPELVTGHSVAGESGRTTLGGGSSDEPETHERGDTPAERDTANPNPDAPAAGTSTQPSAPPTDRGAPADSGKTGTTTPQNQQPRSAPQGGQTAPAPSEPPPTSP